jgi:putative transposase
MHIAPQEVRTFFITSVAHGRRPIFRDDRMARLMIDVLSTNRKMRRFLLHEFVVMPDHFHLIITPTEEVSLEKAIQYIKGGFSFRAKRELGYPFSVWQESYTNHRIRDAQDYAAHVRYVHDNPVEARLARKPSEYRYSSAFPGTELDPAPPGLKAHDL